MIRLSEDKDHLQNCRSCLRGIAYEIIHHSCKPVLIIRLAESSTDGISNIEVVRSKLEKNILFPTDFSDAAVKALKS